MFKDKTLLITGGTGSFGKTTVAKFLDTEIGEIRIFSRDEKKQYDMRKDFDDKQISISDDELRQSMDQFLLQESL